MAWRSSGTSNAELIHNLIRGQVISSDTVKNAMLAVDRVHFTSHNVYEDSPQPIGSNATISAPHMHAYALESLKDKLKKGARVLDVGSGTGYLTACFAMMVGPTGRAVGLEHIDDLVKKSIKNINNWNPQMIESGQIKMICGDGRLGYAEDAPYDAIHVGAAADSIPDALIEQLNIGGRMVLPVGPSGGNQHFVQIDKLHDGKVTKKSINGSHVCALDRQGQTNEIYLKSSVSIFFYYTLFLLFNLIKSHLFNLNNKKFE